MGFGNIAGKSKRLSAIVLAITLIFAAEGCKKKVPPPPPPPPPKTEAPPPPPARPEISQFEAEPATVERGQASTLRWSVTGQATDISITPGIGSVAANGTRQVYPSATTTYTLTAGGPGGKDSRTVTVTIASAPPPPPPKPKEPIRTLSEMLSSMVQDVYFDYDRSDVREDARSVLTRNADALKTIFNQHSGAVVLVEGHADERGSAEYNLGLADRRSTSAKDFLVQLGVPGDRLKTVSYGKERPQCTESNESCWQQNRRAHFSAGQ
jgi:peptidoglycan-associated lipoprotein